VPVAAEIEPSVDGISEPWLMAVCLANPVHRAHNSDT